MIDRNSEFHNSDFEALYPEAAEAYDGKLRYDGISLCLFTSCGVLSSNAEIYYQYEAYIFLYILFSAVTTDHEPLNHGTIAIKSTSSDQSATKSHSSVHNDSTFNTKQLSTSTASTQQLSSSSSSQHVNDELDQDLLLAQRMQQLEDEGLAYAVDEYAVPNDNDYSKYISDSEAVRANREQEDRDMQQAVMLHYQEMNYNSPEEKRRKNTNINKNNKCVIQ